MPSKKVVIKTYVTDEEYGKILELADNAGLSLSMYAKRVCLGYAPESKVDARAVLALIKVNADLGRLGGLLKLWLSEPDRHAPEVRRLLHELEQVKDLLVDRIQTL